MADKIPHSTSLDQIQMRLIVPVQNLVRHPSILRPVHERQSIRTMPLDAHDGDPGVGQDAAHIGFWLVVFEFHNVPSQTDSDALNRRENRIFQGGSPIHGRFLTSEVR